MGERVYNFSAGPGTLPEEVLRQVQQDVWNIGGSGVGILEHSHRGKVVDKIFEECEADIRSLAGVPASYKILFMTGGASAQNYIVPMNLLPKDRVADYLITGYWAQKSYDTAAKLGKCNIAATSKDQNHSYIPSPAQTKWTDKAAYAHYCTNNTIFGTEWRSVPTPPEGVPLVCDMSSDIFSKPMDFTKYALVYAGAQKNMGPAGVTVVIIRDDMVERGSKDITEWLQYRTYVPELSRPNTPPVFAVYVTGLVMKWLKANGGLAAMQAKNEAKAKLIYDVIDSTPFYKGHARPDSRSLMNITFRTPNDASDEKFLGEAKKAGFDSLKGHRSTGGMRASMYNAFPHAGAVAFSQFMRDFAAKNG